jgi:hypothetical protein
LSFALPADTQFDVLNPPPNIALSGAANYVVVNNRGIPGQDAYELANVVTPQGNYSPAANRVPLGAGFQFASPSPTNRAYIVSGLVHYECNLATGALRRYTNLPITNAPTLAPIGAPFDVVANDVTACDVTFQREAMPIGQTPQHGGIATIDMTISRVTNGNLEQLRLLKQVRVENAR